jgi:hypothetical protein
LCNQTFSQGRARISDGFNITSLNWANSRNELHLSDKFSKPKYLAGSTDAGVGRSFSVRLFKNEVVKNESPGGAARDFPQTPL